MPAPSHGDKWTTTDHLLADLIDAVNVNSYIQTLAAINPRGLGQIKPPTPVRRPHKAREQTPDGARVLTFARANQGAAPAHFVDVPACTGAA